MPSPATPVSVPKTVSTFTASRLRPSSSFLLPGSSLPYISPGSYLVFPCPAFLLSLSHYDPAVPCCQSVPGLTATCHTEVPSSPPPASSSSCLAPFRTELLWCPFPLLLGTFAFRYHLGGQPTMPPAPAWPREGIQPLRLANQTFPPWHVNLKQW